MKDIPIIFSGPMVRALLAGRKTMTRRLAWRELNTKKKWPIAAGLGKAPTPWQRVRPGDRLWVRESLDRRGDEGVGYTADGDCHADARWVWKNRALPSIHMPRGLSRLTLIVTDTKIERLQDIGDFEAAQEGAEIGYRPIGGLTGERAINPPLSCSYQFGFEDLWRRLHGAEGWDANPEVVALTFTVHNTNIYTLTAEAA